MKKSKCCNEEIKEIIKEGTTFEVCVECENICDWYDDSDLSFFWEPYELNPDDLEFMEGDLESLEDEEE